MTRPLIWSDNNLFILAFLIRLFFILYARIHDYLFNLNFTDVDYEVFTEAALLVLQGSSPYNLSTYRYSPIIAWILVPNYFFADFGKIIFLILDVFVGWIQLQYFTQYDKNSTTSKEIISNKLILFRRSICFLWLFNLFNIIIATRGNSDALICFLNLLTMIELSKGNYLFSAVIHGLATHLRIFPLIYLPSIFLHLSNYKNKNLGNIKLFILNCLQNKRGFLFIFASIFSFLLSTFIFYLFYGQSFIYSSFLYHLTRVDVSHNFSPYFLPLYLSMNNKEWTKFIGIFSFFPQIICNAFFALKFSDDLPFCWFLTTFAFVSFNKVSTSQYFIWYFCFLPLIIHKIKLNLNKLFSLLAIWLFAQGNWLLPAYLLEFCGYNTFKKIWAKKERLLKILTKKRQVYNFLKFNLNIFLGVRFDKLKGQHILKNPGVVHAIIEKSAIKGTDTVMEVGSGTGNMSLKIMQRAKKLIAFEIDPKMVSELQKRVIGTQNQYKLKIITGDVIKIKEWPQFDICVSNLPYKISSPFVFRLLLQRPLPRYAVLMFQKEFADRLTASPGSKCYCRLSVSVQLLAKVEHLMKVKRSEFVPPPKVDSAVVRIEPRSPPPAICYKEWDGMLRIAFMRKNKTILSLFKQKNVVNILERNYKIVCKSKGKEISDDFSMEELIERTLVDGQFANRRARTMSIEDFLALLINFNKEDIHFS
ncbi:unnamed protein product [Meloidogyne enterolobii]|uniref:Uncharacterized protein n=1 Tax=Meloidogyne enterolobii TaxID=390850 RepID=A0ACB0YDG8_MELEN